MDALGGKGSNWKYERPWIWKRAGSWEELETTHPFGVSGPWGQTECRAGPGPLLGTVLMAAPGQPPSRACLPGQQRHPGLPVRMPVTRNTKCLDLKSSGESGPPAAHRVPLSLCWAHPSQTACRPLGAGCYAPLWVSPRLSKQPPSSPNTLLTAPCTLLWFYRQAP